MATPKCSVDQGTKNGLPAWVSPSPSGVAPLITRCPEEKIMDKIEFMMCRITPRAVRFARLIMLFAGMILLTGTAVFAQSPNSGALLTINGTTNTAVNIQIYDSQIHSAAVQTPPVPSGGNCMAADQIPTDAYVLQGGAPTGCDTGDDYEITDDNSESPHQTSGQTMISGFQIQTHYLCGAYGASEDNQTTCTDVKSSTPACNTAMTICAGPDSGFIEITNMTGYNFTGTISLTGTSPVCGAATDSMTFTDESYFQSGTKVVLALGSPVEEGRAAVDSSNCGGYNAPQTQALTSGATSTFLFGNDAYKVTPINSNAGDILSFIPVPAPAGPLGLDSWLAADFGLQPYPENPVATSALRFSATNFPSLACIPFSDFSAVSNPVCPEIQLICTPAPESVTELLPNGDCGSFLYTAEIDFTIDKNSLPNGVGGVEFLGDHADNCPTANFNINIFLSYTATAPDPVRGEGSGNSCFVATFDPTAKAVATGATVTQQTLEGFFLPVIDNPPNKVFFNKIIPGLTVPLIWQTENSSEKPVTNLTLCGNSTGTGCNAPWVNVASEAISCVTGEPTGAPMTDMSLLNTGLVNLGKGFYTFLWKTSRTANGCVTPVLTFSTGFVSFSVADFKFL
jgi:hypothetical protein